MALTGYYRTMIRPRQHRPLSMMKYDPVGQLISPSPSLSPSLSLCVCVLVCVCVSDSPLTHSYTLTRYLFTNLLFE